MGVDIQRKKLKWNVRLSEQVAQEEPPFILPLLTITLARKRSFILQPKFALYFSIDFFCDWRLHSQTRNSLIFTYFVFSSYLLMMAEQVFVWTQHLCLDVDHGRLRDDLQMQAGWQKKVAPWLQDANCKTKISPHTHVHLASLFTLDQRGQSTEDCFRVCLNEQKKGNKKCSVRSKHFTA